MQKRSKSLIQKHLLIFSIGLLWLAAILVLANFSNRFAQFGAQARQSEVKSNLMHIHTLQTTFFRENGRYGSIKGGGCEPNEIGFQQGNCNASRYEYLMTVNDGSHFKVLARERVVDGIRKVFPSCTSPLDEWTIDDKRNLVSVLYVAGARGGFNDSFFKLPTRGTCTAGVLVGLGLFLICCLFDSASAFFLPAGISRKKLVPMLSAVSTPWIVLAVLLSKEIFSSTAFTSEFLFASAGMAVLVLGFFFSRWSVVNGLRMSSFRRSAVVTTVPVLIIAVSIALMLIPGL